MSMDESCNAETAAPFSARHVAQPSAEELRPYIVAHVDEAVEGGWVVPYYQPVVRTLTGKLCGSEALARWEDPTYGLLMPDKFIPALEDAGLIYKLDCSIVQQVCRQYRESIDAGIPVVPISFNLSRLDFDLCDIFSVIERAVHEYEVPRGMLNIEITETVFGTDPSFMAGMVGKFHDVGYQVWMDDFGSGYSTLNALKDFDFDELKIDMEFLNRFGDKSKTILASVVDMAKKLGIQTLAEGVETEEHRKYLRRIGCEKMQGYLFGKPMPYGAERTIELINRIGVESRTERLYFGKIGSINTLSLSERDLTAGSSTRGYVTSMPLAIVEYSDDCFKVIDSNLVFREGLQNVGVASIEEAEERINDERRLLARQARRLVEHLARDKYARIDYLVNDTACVMRAKHITTQAGRIAMLVSIDDTIEQGEHQRHDRMIDALSVMYTIYEHVDIIHLDEEFIEPVFTNVGYHQMYEEPVFADVTRHFAETELFPEDRDRYIAFMDHDSIVDRINASGERYIVDFFRLRQKGGDYAWKLFALISLVERPGNQVMLCVRSTHWANDGLFQEAYGGHVGEDENMVGAHSAGLHDADMRLTDGSLWRAIIHDEVMGIFWKDRDRRFVGANQTFLDYYGFDSVDVISGKTDEEMGWHIDPVPFREDELRVLNEGAWTRDALGQCIVRGEVRDIMATKRPVYRNGRIIGLVGYFFDATARDQSDTDLERLPLRDTVTGVLNYTGLEAATWRFVDSYVKLGIDFAMISINLENYQHINKELGYEFGEKLLARIGEDLRDIAGHQCAIGHVYAERFVILAQNKSDDELKETCDEVERRLSSISQIDGTPCTVYALASFARYSDYHDIEAMKRSNRDKRLLRQDERGEAGNESSIITSSLL